MYVVVKIKPFVIHSESVKKISALKLGQGVFHSFMCIWVKYIIHNNI